MQSMFASDLKGLYRKARELVGHRLSDRPLIPTSEVLRACQTKELAREGAEVILLELATLLGAESGHFRPHDQLRELLSFDSSDLGPGAAAILEKYGLPHLEVYGEDILWMLTRVSDAEVWERYWNSLAFQPHTDDEWVALLMGMTICELLNTFGEAVTK